jgi:hypothetical protein
MTVGFYHRDEGDARQAALAASMVSTVTRAMPGVPIVQFTTADSAIVEGVAQSLAIGGERPLALDRLVHYATCDGEWLLLDTDVVVQEDVRAVFHDERFDVAVATRDGTLRPEEVGSKFMATMPFNMGAVFSRSAAFWTAAIREIEALPVSRRHWMGDQAAMNAVIASGAFRVRVLSNRFNYPPQHRHEDVSDKAILHYKGPRKTWLLERRVA